MANGRTALVIKPIGQMVEAFRALYQRPANSIRGISDKDSWTSPLQPVQPFGPPGTEPHAFQTRSGQNLVYTPRPDAEWTAADLKDLATYPLARICIENVKDIVGRAPWEIQLRARPGETRDEVKRRQTDQDKNTVTKLNDFFQYPDREHNWQEWLRPLLDDLLVIDAPSILMRRTFNGDLAELAVIRGEMISKYVDANGFTPMPPSPAYAQNWWGLPLVNMTTDQLIYKPRSIVPRNSLSSQMYGMSVTEQLANELLIGIERLRFVLAYYKEGSVPGVVHVVPRGTSPDKIEEAMEWMNSKLAGNLAARNQWRMIQGFNEPGKEDQIIFSKEPLLAGVYDDKHIRQVAYGYGVSPQRLQKMIRTEGKGTADAAEVEGTLPWVLWVKGIVDFIIQRKMGLMQYEMSINPFAEPDPLKNAAGITMLVSKAVITPNEARKRVGEELRPEPEADRLGVITGTGFIPVGIPSVRAGVQITDEGKAQPHPIVPTAQPADRPGPGDSNSSRGEKPPQQEAGGGRSTGRNVGTPNGRESLDGKKKLAKQHEPRIDPDILTPESHQAVHYIQAVLRSVFTKQYEHAQVEANRLIKAASAGVLKRKFGSVQFNLSPEHAQDVLAIPVDSSDLAEKGRELNPHTTVLYGFHPEVTAEQINSLTRGIGEVEIMLGDFEAFAPGEDGEPLVIRFESDKLQKLHEDLAQLPHTDTHPEYKPHINVAYLLPRSGQKYVDAGNPLKGQVMTLRNLVFSGIDYSVSELMKLSLAERIQFIEAKE